jgi:hypothetical protein
MQAPLLLRDRTSLVPHFVKQGKMDRRPIRELHEGGRSAEFNPRRRAIGGPATVDWSSMSLPARLCRFTAALGLIALVWMVVLPAAARTEIAARHIRTMEEGRINPGAMFYTELETPPAASIPLNAVPTAWRTTN